MRAAGATDPGCKREENQDSFLIDEDIGLFIVADGMGGHKGGELASSIAVSTLRDYIRAKRWDKDRIGVVRNAFSLANKAIMEKASEDPELSGMGTTATMAWITEGRMIIAHVGDSRAYLYRKGELFRITKDHSLLQDLIERGRVKPEEGRGHVMRNIITKALGVSEDLTPDIFVDRFEPTDALLLCTDGLTVHLTDGRIEEAICAKGDDPEMAVNALIEEAKAEGGSDNITAILVVGDRFKAIPLVAPALIRVRKADRGKAMWVAAALLMLVLSALFLLGGMHLTLSSKGGELVICRSLMIPGTTWVTERTGLPSSWADLVEKDWRGKEVGRIDEARKSVARIFVKALRMGPRKVKRIWIEKGLYYVEKAGIDRIGFSNEEISDFLLDLGDIALSIGAWGLAFDSYSRALAYCSGKEEFVERAIRGMVESNYRAGMLGEYMEMLRKRLASNPNDDLAKRILVIGSDIRNKKRGE